MGSVEWSRPEGTTGKGPGPAWLTHNLGGTIRRVLVWGGPDVMAVLNAEEMVCGEMADHGMWGAFSAACNTHNDYVWKSEARSTP